MIGSGSALRRLIRPGRDAGELAAGRRPEGGGTGKRNWDDFENVPQRFAGQRFGVSWCSTGQVAVTL